MADGTGLIRVDVRVLLRRDRALDVGRLEPFSGLSVIFGTVASLKRYDVLSPFSERPAEQVADGRINEEYIKALCTAFSLPYDKLETGSQVHGTRVVLSESVERRHNEATDGLIVSRPGGAAAVFTADCQAVIVWDPFTRVVAVAHAGWRGAVARIAGSVVSTIVAAYGVKKEDIYAFLGPTISREYYEVGPAAAEAAAAVFPDGGVLSAKKSKVYLDISKCNIISLLDAGISDDKIYALDACTYREADMFYSYRRDGARAGRNITAVYIPETRR